jgi:lipoic acid synthetase
VLTSVDRDDLPDQGSELFARTVHAIKQAHPEVLVESLIPDFRADRECLRRVAEAGGEVVAHNVETTRALTRTVRDLRCDFDQSLRALAQLKEMAPGVVTKSSLMLGLGETEDEVVEAMRDLRSVQVDIVTLGQYLQPTPHHHPVIEYHAPEVFDRLRVRGLELGFRFVAAGPLVRSSYRAAEAFVERELRGH